MAQSRRTCTTADHGLVRVEKLYPTSGELWLIHLTSAGSDVAGGRGKHFGVALPEVG